MTVKAFAMAQPARWVMAAPALLLACSIFAFEVWAQDRQAPDGGTRRQSNNADVAVGGVDGFDKLANPANTFKLRGTHRARLYLHDYIWQRTAPEMRASIAQAFEGCEGPVLEGSESSHMQAYWKERFDGYRAANLSPLEAHVNLVSKNGELGALSFEQWQEYVKTARTYGIRIVAPVFSPNSGQWKKDGFNSHVFDKLRQFAKCGGGITLDSPPDYFLNHPPGYQDFVLKEIRWARENHLKCTAIISPPYEGGEFGRPTRMMIAFLKEKDALPDAYIVENYRAKPPAHFINDMGNEETPETITNVALWIAQHVARAKNR